MNRQMGVSVLTRALLVALALVTSLGMIVPEEASAQRTTKSLLGRGRVEIGLNLAGSFNSTTITPKEGDETELSTLYLNPNLYFGLTVVDNLQLRLLLGFQNITTDVNGSTLQDSGTTSLLLQGAYHLPLQKGFAFYGGVGAGGFFGSTERELAPNLIANSSTNGFIGQFLLGVLSQPGDSLTLKFGVRFDALIGSEDPGEDNANPLLQELDSTNLQALLELSVGFRFGNGF